jgi:signal-transduction protein with cAMP-binding, CBS, and nucleotidyltransferase domain
MPVVDGNRVRGIVSQRDLFAASLSKTIDFEPTERRAFLHAIDVSEVMSQDVMSVSPDTTLREAARRILRHGIGCLPVVEDDTLVGLVTETDLLRAAFLDEGEALDVEVAEKEEEMADLGKRIDEEVEDLRRLRDELRVQMHLAKAEAKELWDDMEQRFSDIEGKAKQVARQAEGPLEDIGEAARLLAEEIRNGYRRIRDML